jgi:1,4-alpha-glucan branching enzyme
MSRNSTPTAKNEMTPIANSPNSSNTPAQAGAAPTPGGAKSKGRSGRANSKRRAVRFGLEIAGAKKVYVVGTFNEWHPEATPLRCVGGSKWYAYVSLDVGRYEYRYVVDGKWVDAPEAEAYVPNAQGGRNAVVEVAARSSDM